MITAHQAKIKEKPEVRKAGGVYYTSQYIVDYIVQNAVGEKAKRKKPEDIEHLRIVDPACCYFYQEFSLIFYQANILQDNR